MPDTHTTPTDLDLARRDLVQVKAALNDPRIGLFASRKLYARYGQLLRQIDALKAKDTNDNDNRQ